MESLLKVDRLDDSFIGSASFQSSRWFEPTQRFMLHRREPSGEHLLDATPDGLRRSACMDAWRIGRGLRCVVTNRKRFSTSEAQRFFPRSIPNHQQPLASEIQLSDPMRPRWGNWPAGRKGDTLARAPDRSKLGCHKHPRGHTCPSRA